MMGTADVRRPFMSEASTDPVERSKKNGKASADAGRDRGAITTCDPA